MLLSLRAASYVYLVKLTFEMKKIKSCPISFPSRVGTRSVQFKFIFQNLLLRARWQTMSAYK